METGTTTPPTMIRRTIAAVAIAQAVIALLLVVSDLASAVPRVDPITQPGLTGPATRPYTPRQNPFTGPQTSPMPDRLQVSGEGETLTITGQIDPGDGPRVSQILATREGITGVALNSTGGLVSDALEIGAAIRALGLTTEIRDGDICLSACPYIFAGGVERRVAPTGSLGVHQHYFGENTILPAFLAVEDIQRGQAQVMAHLARMGIGLGVMELAMRTPPDEIYVLSPEELAEFSLVTD